MQKQFLAMAFSVLCPGLANTALAAQQAPPEQGQAPTNLEQRSDGHWTANDVPTNLEGFQVHVVGAGDTLWSIAQRYMNDPFLWPQLWEGNPHIVNPHWVYPEDQILIQPITQITDVVPPEAPRIPPPPEPTEPRQVQIPELPLSSQTAQLPPADSFVFETDVRAPAPEVKASDLYCSGFVTTRELASSQNVMAMFSNGERLLSTDGHYVYVSQGSAAGVSPGDLLTVVRPTRTIDSPRDGVGQLGRHYLELGQLRAITVQPEFSLARVVHSCDAIAVGDLVVGFEAIDFPELPRNRPFSPMLPSTGRVTGAIAISRDSLSNTESQATRGANAIPGVRSSHLGSDLGNLAKGVVSEGQIVYVDLGQQDGVQEGNIFLIYRPQDFTSRFSEVSTEAERLLAEERIVIGELVVLKVEERAATALVTFSSSAVVAGDRVELR